MKKNLKRLLLSACAVASLALTACSARLSGIESDLDNLKGRVSALEHAVGELQSAYDAGKTITSVESIDCADSDRGGVFGDLLRRHFDNAAQRC